MFLRILIWLLAILGGWWLLRSRGRVPPPSRGTASARVRPAPPEAMVDCVQCGVHVPVSAVLRDAAARPYCCAEHAQAGPRDGG